MRISASLLDAREGDRAPPLNGPLRSVRESLSERGASFRSARVSDSPFEAKEAEVSLRRSHCAGNPPVDALLGSPPKSKSACLSDKWWGFPA